MRLIKVTRMSDGAIATVSEGGVIASGLTSLRMIALRMLGMPRGEVPPKVLIDVNGSIVNLSIDEIDAHTAADMIAKPAITIDQVADFMADPKRRWTLQGFGMLRTYLTSDKRRRLHVWSSMFAREGANVYHDHPWEEFESQVIQGAIANEVVEPTAHSGIDVFRRRIVCGENGCSLTEPTPDLLAPVGTQIVTAGRGYVMRRNEIHMSHVTDGTVTVIDRRLEGDTETAHVFWPATCGRDGWISAEPREATRTEVMHFRNIMLARREIERGTP